MKGAERLGVNLPIFRREQREMTGKMKGAKREQGHSIVLDWTPKKGHKYRDPRIFQRI